MKKQLLLHVICTLSLLATNAAAETTCRLETTRKSGDVDQVTVQLEVGGKTIGQLDGKEQQAKMSVVCKLDYHEKTLDWPIKSGDGKPRSVRYYDKAEAAIRVDKDTLTPTLRPQRRLIAVELQSQKAAFFSPNGPLSREELALVDIQGNTLLLDRLLPEKAVAVGDQWTHSKDLVVALFGPDTVTQCDVKSTLTEITDQVARMEISGRVKGTYLGAATQMVFKGKYRFDRRSGRIDWFGLLVKENRSGNEVTEGLDVVARVQVTVGRHATCEELSPEALKGLAIEATPKSRLLQYEPTDCAWQCVYDRRWIITRESTDKAVLQMVDHGDMLAQCRISPLRKGAKNEPIELSRFQEDVRGALGESFGQFDSAGVQMNSADYRVYRVVVSGEARGSVSGKETTVPIQWRYYLVAERTGRRVVFAFSLEEALAERFGNEDLKLVNSLRFPEESTAAEEAGG
jgi:hypothetical protein